MRIYSELLPILIFSFVLILPSMLNSQETNNAFAEEFNVTTAVFIQSKSLTSEDGTVSDVVLSPNGTKMYMLGFDNKRIFEYNLSSAWDVSTTAYTGKSFVVGDGSPQGLFLREDGLKIFVIGNGGDNVYAYNMSNPFDISTAVLNQTRSISAETNAPVDVEFSGNGTKMYVMDFFSGDDVSEYTLSTAWDLSTETFIQSFSFTAQETTGTGLHFKPDGTIMYVAGDEGDDVNEYHLSNPFDISTAVFNQTFIPSESWGFTQGLYFRSDGGKMYVSSDESVFEYDLTELMEHEESDVVVVVDNVDLEFITEADVWHIIEQQRDGSPESSIICNNFNETIPNIELETEGRCTLFKSVPKSEVIGKDLYVDWAWSHTNFGSSADADVYFEIIDGFCDANNSTNFPLIGNGCVGGGAGVIYGGLASNLISSDDFSREHFIPASSINYGISTQDYVTLSIKMDSIGLGRDGEIFPTEVWWGDYGFWNFTNGNIYFSDTGIGSDNGTLIPSIFGTPQPTDPPILTVTEDGADLRLEWEKGNDPNASPSPTIYYQVDRKIFPNSTFTTIINNTSDCSSFNGALNPYCEDNLGYNLDTNFVTTKIYTGTGIPQTVDDQSEKLSGFTATYKVRSYNIAGLSSDSTEKSATTILSTTGFKATPAFVNDIEMFKSSSLDSNCYGITQTNTRPVGDLNSWVTNPSYSYPTGITSRDNTYYIIRGDNNAQCTIPAYDFDLDDLFLPTGATPTNLEIYRRDIVVVIGGATVSPPPRGIEYHLMNQSATYWEGLTHSASNAFEEWKDMTGIGGSRNRDLVLFTGQYAFQDDLASEINLTASTTGVHYDELNQLALDNFNTKFFNGDDYFSLSLISSDFESRPADEGGNNLYFGEDIALNGATFIQYGQNGLDTLTLKVDYIDSREWGLREHDTSASGDPTIDFTSGSTVINSTSSSFGEGYIFKVFPTDDIINKRIRIDWAGLGSGTNSFLEVLDGRYDKDNFTDFPSEATRPLKGGGVIGNLSSPVHPFSSTTQEMTLNWGLSALNETTVFVHLKDSDASGTFETEINSIEIGGLAFVNFTSPQIFYNSTTALNDTGNILVDSLPSIAEVPQSLTATPVGADVDLDWDDVVDIPDVEGFIIIRDGVPLVITGNTTSFFTDTSVSFATNHAYNIQSTGFKGNSTNSNTANILTNNLSDFTAFTEQVFIKSPPFPITNLNGATVSNTCELTWSTPSNGNSPINGYKILRKATGEGSFSVLVANTTTTLASYTDTGLVNGIVYQYDVRALNAFGDAISSNIDDCSPVVSGVTNEPTNLDANEESNGDITLTWNKPSSGDPTGYQIQRKITTGGSWVTIVNNTATTSMTYLDTTTNPATEYIYRVAGWNFAGLGAFSNEATITTSSPPSAPILSAVQNVNQIDLSWVAPSSDFPINGYKIERRVNFGAFSILVANTTTTAVTYTDLDVMKPNTYGYRVKALSNAGEGTVSNVVDVVFGSHVVVQVREQDSSGFKGGGRVRISNATFSDEVSLNSNSNAVFDNYPIANFNYTFIDNSEFILNKTFNFPFPSGNLTSTFTVSALVFDVDCPANGAGADVRIKVNYTDAKDIFSFPSTPVCDSTDQVSWSTRWIGDNVTDSSIMVADFISTVFKANAKTFLASADEVPTTYSGGTNAIKSDPFQVNATDVTINFNLFLGRAPAGGGGGDSGSGTTTAPSPIQNPNIIFQDRLSGLSLLSRTHQFVQAGDVIEGSITVNWEGEENLSVVGVDVGDQPFEVRFELPPFPLEQEIEGIGEFAKSTAEIPYTIIVPPVECNAELGISQNCFDPILHTVPVQFKFKRGDQEYDASTEIFVDGRPVPLDIVQLQIILLFLVLVASAVFGRFIRNRFKKSTRRVKTAKKKFKKKFDAS